MKKVVVISTSNRVNRNSDSLARAFAKGASDAGNEVQYISLVNKEIRFCKGCLACQKLHRCVMNDDVEKIIEAMKKADVIAFATPIYFYEMSGQMKTLLDRTNPLYDTDYKFKEIYLLASAADEEASAIDGARNGLQGWVDCFDRAVIKDCVYVLDTENIERIDEHHSVKKAYICGKNA